MTDKFDPPQPDTTQEKALREAWQALESGTADRAQGKRIIRHLSMLTGYYNGLNLAQWMHATGSPHGFEAACLELQAKRWVFSQVLSYLTEHADGRGSDT